jgi:hypothetical protein
VSVNPNKSLNKKTAGILIAQRNDNEFNAVKNTLRASKPQQFIKKTFIKRRLISQTVVYLKPIGSVLN